MEGADPLSNEHTTDQEQEVLLPKCVATHGSGRATWMNLNFHSLFAVFVVVVVVVQKVC